jgi:hypothetical protein
LKPRIFGQNLQIFPHAQGSNSEAANFPTELTEKQKLIVIEQARAQKEQGSCRDFLDPKWNWASVD